MESNEINYDVLKPWEHGKMVEVYPQKLGIAVYSVVYENKDFFVCRIDGGTELLTLRKGIYTYKVFSSYEAYQKWIEEHPTWSSKCYIFIPKNQKITFADYFNVKTGLDVELEKTEKELEDIKRGITSAETDATYYQLRSESLKKLQKEKEARLEALMKRKELGKKQIEAIKKIHETQKKN